MPTNKNIRADAANEASDDREVSKTDGETACAASASDASAGTAPTPPPRDRKALHPSAPDVMFRGQYAADRSIYAASLLELTASTVASVQAMADGIRNSDYPDDELLEASSLLVSRSNSLCKRDGGLVEETVAATLGLHPDLHVFTQFHVDVPTKLLGLLEENPSADLADLPNAADPDDDTRCAKLDLCVVDYRRGATDGAGRSEVVVHVLECRRGGGKSDTYYVRKTRAKLRAAVHLLPSMLSSMLGVAVTQVRTHILDVYGRSSFPDDMVLRPADLDACFRLPVAAQITAATQALRDVRTDLQREALVAGARADAGFRTMLLDAAGAVEAGGTSGAAGGDEVTEENERTSDVERPVGSGDADADRFNGNVPAGDYRRVARGNVVPLVRDAPSEPDGSGRVVTCLDRTSAGPPHDPLDTLLCAIDRFAQGVGADPDAVVDRLCALVERQVAVADLRSELTLAR